MCLGIVDKWKVGRRDLEMRIFQEKKITKVFATFIFAKKLNTSKIPWFILVCFKNVSL